MWNLKNKTTNKTETEPTDTRTNSWLQVGRGKNEEQR